MEHNVLVLDDDFQVRNSLVMHLEDEDFIVHTAESAEEAFNILDNRIVDLVIVDLRLPGLDGIDFISVAHERHSGLKFIIFTGSPEFHVPQGIFMLQCVSNTLFQKPLQDLSLITNEITKMLR